MFTKKFVIILNKYTMKKIKRIAAMLLGIIMLATIMTSCAGVNNLSNEEAYDLGYGIGRVASYYLGN